ncbi:MAG: ribosomal small subunit methyltransferase [Pseudomonadota bacterium]|jgi:16S rRNA (guanine527-N7)-methyltransferase
MSVDAALTSRLNAGMRELNLALPAGASEQLLAYLEQLHKWNKAYNLSGIKDIHDMLTLHLLDSLALAPLIDADLVADVGTGAGLPGIPLAICYPDKQFCLVDSNSKKTRFIFNVVATLGLRNVEVIHRRAEDYESHPQVAIVTSRAFASLRDFVVRCDHMLAQNGKFLAMKGLIPDDEIADLPAHYQVTAIHPLSLPGSAHVRHVLDIRRATA